MSKKFFVTASAILTLTALSRAQQPPAPGGQPSDDVERGKLFFQQTCALCHAGLPGLHSPMMAGEGPSLAGVVGRRAASVPNFNYTKALTDSGLTWDTATLDRFLSNPTGTVPGTLMLIAVPDTDIRRRVVAFLGTLKAPAGGAPVVAQTAAQAAGTNTGDWKLDYPGLKHRIDLAALPAPFATGSAGNGPKVVKQPEGAKLSVSQNFRVRLFAAGLSGPRLMRTAPNGDIFISETGRNRLRVLRAADGADEPSENKVFADGLDRPFGMAFYPSSDDPQWIYVANNNSVVRLAYHNGDLAASGAPEVIVPHFSDSTGGHTSRDVAFSKDDQRMFIAVGSGSNVGESVKKKTADEIAAWEAEHGLGAGWDSESNRANILVTDPLGKQPLRKFATGVRNGVSILTDKNTGELWTVTNERDGLGDDLVPDYATHLQEGAWYGWPWYYMGNHEDPRHAGERPDLAGKATIPDVPFQAHSAALGLVFYPATTGASAFPEEYQDDIFVTLHGSWNRTTRTGYKVVRVRRHGGAATGEYEDFLIGFVVDNNSVWGRPVGIAVAHDGALLVTDDGNGTLWRISYHRP